MTKWVAVLGGGATAAVVGAGLYLSGVLAPGPTPPQPEPEPQQAVAPPPEDSGAETAPVAATPEPEAPAQPVVTEAPPPPEVRAEEVAAEAPPPKEPEPAPIAAPTFDIVRIEPDGSALIAGQGVAESAIRVLLDGADIAEAQAGRDGKFVSLLAIAPSDQPRLMSLIMSVGGAEYPSETEIIVAPFGPESELAEPELAEAEPEPEPEREDMLASVTEAAGAPSAPPPAEADATETGGTERAGAQDGDTAADAVPAAEDLAAPETPKDDAPATELAPDVADVADPTPVAEPTDTEMAGTPEESVPSETVTDTAAADPVQPAPIETAGAAQEEDPTEADAIREPAQPDMAASPEASDAAQDLAQSDIADNSPEPAPETAPEPAPETAPEPVKETEEAPPTLLASDKEGVRVLQGPEVLDSVAIDTISYDEAGDVALAGRGATSEEGGFVRIYLDNTPVTSSRIREDGSWRVNLPEVDKGVYTLRVDEVDEDGTVKSRAETPFQREDRETLERVAGDEGDAPLRVLTVQPGNTLWQIARDRYGEGLLYVRVFEANKGQIRDPDLIYPGQVFDLPEAAD